MSYVVSGHKNTGKNDQCRIHPLKTCIRQARQPIRELIVTTVYNPLYFSAMYNCKKISACGLILLWSAALLAQTPFFTKINFDEAAGWISPGTLRPTEDGRLLLSITQAKPALLELDGSGNLLNAWRVPPGGATVPKLFDTWELPGKDKICLVGIVEPAGSGPGVFRLFVKRYTADFQEVWSIHLDFGTDAAIGKYYRLFPDQAGNFYACVGGHLPSRLLKFSATGQMLWTKQIPASVEKAILATNGNVLLSVIDGPNLANHAVIQINSSGVPVNAVRLREAASIYGLQLNTFPGGDVLVNWFGDSRWNFARLSPALGLLHAWSMPVSGHLQQDNVVIAGDSLFYCFGFEGSGSIVFRLNGTGLITKAVYVPEIIPILSLSAQPAPFGPNGLALASVSALDPKSLLVMHLDSSLALPNCTVYPYSCIDTRALSAHFDPEMVALENAVPAPYSRTFNWAPEVPAAGAYCPAFKLPQAGFYLPDSVCTSAVLLPDALLNENAIDWRWQLSNAAGQNFVTGIQPSLQFDTPGLWTVTQEITYFGCQKDSFSRIITVLPMPEVLLGSDVTLCNRDTFAITATVLQADTWAWEDQSTGLIRTILQTGSYSLTASSGFCSASDSIVVNFVQLDASFTGPDSICAGLPFSPEPAATPAGTSHRWLLSPPVIPVNPIEKPGLSLHETGIFQLTHQVESEGCRDTSESTFLALRRPEINFQSDLTPCLDSQFILLPDTAFASSFQWADGYPELDRPIPNDSILTLYVSNGICQQVASIIIHRKNCKPPQVYIPNVFAPDSGGENAVFKVFTNDGARVELFEIFDRWGNLVFHGARGDGWDGQFRGRPAPPGVYAWYTRLTLDDGSAQFLQGSVALLR